MLILSILMLMVASSEAANILGLATYDGRSHWLVMEGVFKALADAGHNVTVITPYSKNPRANFSVIDISKVLPIRTNTFTFEQLKLEYDTPYLTFHIIPFLCLGQCDKAHALPEVREILDGKRKFDLVITELFGADCDAVFAHLLDTPLITVVGSTSLLLSSLRVGNPENPSYIPNILLPYSSEMTFFQRLMNTRYYLHTYIAHNYFNSYSTEINRKHFGKDIPPVEEIIKKRTSLVFINSHFSVDVSRPMVPNFVEIGGIHLPPLKPLPKEISSLLDDAENGVIYFSLGSIVKASSLSQEQIEIFKGAFAELKETVLWKFEDESLNVSSNVIIKKWFPQRDILAHPNVKLAILHGGLMGVYEVVDVGVPLLGIPIFFDQHRNVMNLVSKGCAVYARWDTLSKDTLLRDIKTIINNSSYQVEAKKLSQRFKDRPIPPSELVAYWVDYVIKYKGAYHLRSVGADLPLYKYLLLDIISFVLLVILLVLYVLKRLIILIFRFITCQKNVSSKKNSKATHLKTN